MKGLGLKVQGLRLRAWGLGSKNDGFRCSGLIVLVGLESPKIEAPFKRRYGAYIYIYTYIYIWVHADTGISVALLGRPPNQDCVRFNLH